MSTKEDYLTQYLAVAPLSHGLIRAIECRVLSDVPLVSPTLDIGCGDGLFASILLGQRKGAIDVGLDISKSELGRGRQGCTYGELVAGDATRLPFGDGSFRTVLSNSALEHIPNLDSAMAEIARVLRPGGKGVFIVPSESLSSYFVYSRILRRFGLRGLADSLAQAKEAVFRNLHRDSPQEWAVRLEGAGMRMVSHRYFNPLPVEGFLGLFLPLSLISVACRKVLGRPMPLSRRVFLRPAVAVARKYFTMDGPEGASLLIIGERN